jgi:hypothetical protein
MTFAYGLTCFGNLIVRLAVPGALGSQPGSPEGWWVLLHGHKPSRLLLPLLAR